MIPFKDLQILTYIRNGLSVLIIVLGGVWIWAIKSEHWLKDYAEPNLVVVGALIAFCQFLLMRWGGGQIMQANKPYNIPNTHDNQKRLKQAREAIANAKTESALRILSGINTPSVIEQTTLLSARFAKLRQMTIEGIDSRSDETTAFNRLNKDILSFITSLETVVKEATKFETEVRDYLKKRYTDRLNQKLANRQPINLRQLPTTEGTSEETSETFVAIGNEEIKDHIAQIFHAAYGRLLITGKPGAGKTTLLLQLELALLDTETDDLPVLLNLATWKKEFITLETWLKEILPAELGTSKSYAVEILQQNRLVLLFDGLDEVKDKDRQSCLEAIGRYRETANRQYVITSRIAEYKQVAKDAPVNLQIEVGDLTIEQMEAELERVGRTQAEAIPLLKAIQKNALIREAAKTPFYFNTLQLLFAGGKTLSDLNLKGTTNAEIHEEITSRFVEYELANITSDKNYPTKDAQKYLSFLAFNLLNNDKVVFELVDFQYDSYPFSFSRRKLVIIKFIHGLVGGLVFGFVLGLVLSFATSLVLGFALGLALGLDSGFWGGLVLGLISGLISGLVFGLVLGLVLGLISGLALGLISGLYGAFSYKILPLIRTRDSIKWSWSLYFQFIKKNFIFAIFSGFIFAIFIGLSGAFSDKTLPLIETRDSTKWLWSIYSQFIKENFVVVFVLGFIVGFLSSLANAFSDYLEFNSKTIIKINKPYQRFIASMKMGYFSILQHWHLMYLLHKKSLLPRKIVPFLNDMVKHKILESDGASWRFRHRILQDYFYELGNFEHSANSYYNKGNHYAGKTDYDKAIAFYQKATEIKPDFHEAHIGLGFCQIVIGKIAAAETILQKAIDCGSLTLGNMNLGHVYLCQGDEDKALICYKTSLHHFNNIDGFYASMVDDFQYLVQYGITEDYYEGVLGEIESA